MQGSEWPHEGNGRAAFLMTGYLKANGWRKQRPSCIPKEQESQTAALVLKHRLPHSAKPHPRILPQRGISMMQSGETDLSQINQY
jgi:hypothetical protein